MCLKTGTRFNPWFWTTSWVKYVAGLTWSMSGVLVFPNPNDKDLGVLLHSGLFYLLQWSPWGSPLGLTAAAAYELKCGAASMAQGESEHLF